MADSKTKSSSSQWANMQEDKLDRIILVGMQHDELYAAIAKAHDELHKVEDPYYAANALRYTAGEMRTLINDNGYAVDDVKAIEREAWEKEQKERKDVMDAAELEFERAKDALEAARKSRTFNQSLFGDYNKSRSAYLQSKHDYDVSVKQNKIVSDAIEKGDLPAKNVDEYTALMSSKMKYYEPQIEQRKDQLATAKINYNDFVKLNNSDVSDWKRWQTEDPEFWREKMADYAKKPGEAISAPKNKEDKSVAVEEAAHNEPEFEGETAFAENVQPAQQAEPVQSEASTPDQSSASAQSAASAQPTPVDLKNAVNASVQQQQPQTFREKFKNSQFMQGLTATGRGLAQMLYFDKIGSAIKTAATKVRETVSDKISRMRNAMSDIRYAAKDKIASYKDRFAEKYVDKAAERDIADGDIAERAQKLSGFAKEQSRSTGMNSITANMYRLMGQYASVYQSIADNPDLKDRTRKSLSRDVREAIRINSKLTKAFLKNPSLLDGIGQASHSDDEPIVAKRGNVDTYSQRSVNNSADVSERTAVNEGPGLNPV